MVSATTDRFNMKKARNSSFGGMRDSKSWKENSPNSNYLIPYQVGAEIDPALLKQVRVSSSGEFIVRAENIGNGEYLKPHKASVGERKLLSVKPAHSPLLPTSAVSRIVKSNAQSSSSGCDLQRLKVSTSPAMTAPHGRLSGEQLSEPKIGSSVNSTQRKLGTVIDTRKPGANTMRSANSLRRLSVGRRNSGTPPAIGAPVQIEKVSTLSQEKPKLVPGATSTSKSKGEQVQSGISTTFWTKNGFDRKEKPTRKPLPSERNVCAIHSTESKASQHLSLDRPSCAIHSLEEKTLETVSLDKPDSAIHCAENETVSNRANHSNSTDSDEAHDLSILIQREQQLSQQVDLYRVLAQQRETKLIQKDLEIEKVRIAEAMLRDLVSNHSEELATLKANSRDALKENSQLRNLSRKLEQENKEANDSLRLVKEQRELEVSSCLDQVRLILRELDSLTSDLAPELLPNLSVGGIMETLGNLQKEAAQEEASLKERCFQIVQELGFSSPAISDAVNTLLTNVMSNQSCLPIVL